VATADPSLRMLLADIFDSTTFSRIILLVADSPWTHIFSTVSDVQNF